MAQEDTDRVHIGAEFYNQVYDAVRDVPYGRVSTYGHIAKMTGHPRHSRMVGQALKFLPERYHDEDSELFVPWHRIINSSGVIPARGSPEAVERQAINLRAEGVTVNGGGQGALEGGRVSLARFGWFDGVASASASSRPRPSAVGPDRRRRRAQASG